MDQQAFWDIVHQGKKESGGNLVKQVLAIARQLRQLSPCEIEHFEWIYQGVHSLADRQALRWQLTEIAGDDVDENMFDVFRCWLVAQGEGIYRELLCWPALLCEFFDWRTTRLGDSFNYVSYEIYEELTDLCVWDELRERYPNAYPISGYEWLEVE